MQSSHRRDTETRKESPNSSALPRPGGSFFLLRHPRCTWTIAIVLLALAAFAGSIRNGYVHDDVSIVERNPLASSIRRLPEIFRTDYWHGATSLQVLPDPGRTHQEKVYRPMTILSFAATASLLGHSPAAHHSINIALHIGASLLVMWCLLGWGWPVRISGPAGLLFAVHPLHAEAVEILVGRAELLATCGVLGGIAVIGVARRQTWTIRTMLVPVAAGCWLAGLLSKESAVLFVPFLILALWFDVESDQAHSVKRLWARLWETGWMLCVAALPISASVFFRRTVIGSTFGGYIGGKTARAPVSFIVNPVYDLSFFDRVPTTIGLIGKYIGLHLWPHPLVIDYSYDVIPRIRSLADGSFLFGGAAVIGLLGWAIRERRIRHGVTIGLLFWLGGLVLFSNLFVPYGTIFAERVTYLPSFGFCLVAAVVGSRLVDWARTKRLKNTLGGIGIGVILGALSMCVVGHANYRDTPTAATYALEHGSGRSALLWYIVGDESANHGATDAALAAFQRSAAIYPDPSTLDRIGSLQASLGRWPDAVTAARQAVERDGTWWPYRKRLAVALAQTGNIDGAIKEFETALALAPRDSLMHISLGNLLLRKNDPSGAERHFRAALAGDNPPPVCYRLLGDVLVRQDRFSDAVEAYAAYLRAAPNAPDAATVRAAETTLRRQKSSGR